MTEPAPAPTASGAMAAVADAAKAVAAPVASAVASAKSYIVVDRSAGRKPGPAGQGLASWYGKGFEGRRTANGEVFDGSGFTAAHPSFPLPSYVRVTNVSNGRSMVVRVNDRGPFHKGRLIDVSQRTADVLGFRGAGVGNVKIDYVGRAPAGVRDDRRLIATYQEFGRPTAAGGVQMASARPVSDAELAAETTGGASVLVASAAPAPQPGVVTTTVVARPAAAQPAVRPAPVETVASLGAVATVPRAEPELASVGLTKPVVLPKATPLVTPTAVAAVATRPSVAKPPVEKPSAPTIAVASAATRADPAKRVVQPAAPVLASAGPVSAAPAVDAVASRIASSFDSFGDAAFRGSVTAAAPGSAIAYQAVR